MRSTLVAAVRSFPHRIAANLPASYCSCQNITLPIDTFIGTALARLAVAQTSQ